MQDTIKESIARNSSLETGIDESGGRFGIKESTPNVTVQQDNNIVRWREDFAVVLLDGGCVKVEIIRRIGTLESRYTVEPVDGGGMQFEVSAQELTPYGSHDPESESSNEQNSRRLRHSWVR